MQVDANDTIAGHPILKMRDFFRRAGDDWSVEWLAEYLGVSAEQGGVVLDELIRSGFVEQADTRWGPSNRLSEKGRALVLAKASKPVRRATAERTLEGLLQRADAVNADDRFLYQVSRIVVFGSFLGDRERLGDLDVAVELRPREPDPDRHQALSQRKIAEALEAGRRFGNIVEELSWPQREVLLYLKAGSRTISLHPIDDGVLRHTQTREVYRLPEGRIPWRSAGSGKPAEAS